MTQPGRPGKLSSEQWDTIAQWDREENLSRAGLQRRIKAEFGVDITRSRIGQVLGRRMGADDAPTGTREYKFVLLPEHNERLRELAAEIGERQFGGSVDAPGNISGMLRGIAEGEYAISRV